MATEDRAIRLAEAVESGVGLRGACAVDVEEGVAYAREADQGAVDVAAVGAEGRSGDVAADEVVGEELTGAFVAAVAGPDALADAAVVALLVALHDAVPAEGAGFYHRGCGHSR